MISIVWSDSALDDLDSIRDYIAQFHPRAATEFVERLRAAANALATFPSRGRGVIGEESLRELTVVYPYIIRYENVGTTVTILDIRHGMRRDGDD